MADLYLGQDVANKRERKQTAAHIVAKPYPLYLAVRMRRYGSLFNINPSLRCFPRESVGQLVYGLILFERKGKMRRHGSSMIHSASTQCRQRSSLDFVKLGRRDGRTICVKIVISIGRYCDRPRRSTNLVSYQAPS